ncbi:MAG: hypothetical protein ACLQDF_01995 [Desulfomonilia bacterium]
MAEQNLTKYLKVVSEEVSGVHPTKGYDLVVFKEKDQGIIFHKVLTSGVTIDEKRFIPFKKERYVSYQVSTAKRIRHSFHSHVDHTSQGHSFDIDYTIIFEVKVPQVIVERLIDDPVRTLENHIKDCIDAEVGIIPWKMLVSSILSDGGHTLKDKLWADHQDELQRIAENYGIDLIQIHMKWKLSQEDKELFINEAAAERELLQHQTNTKKEREKLKEELDSEEILHESMRKKHNREGEIAKQKKLIELGLKDLESSSDFREVLFKYAGEALSNITGGINTPEQLIYVYSYIFNRVKGSGVSGSADMGWGDSPGGITLLASGYNSDGHSPVIKSLLDEAVQKFENFSVEERKKRQILSTILHLIAETYLDEKGDSERLKEYREAIKGIIIELNPVLSRDQHSYLKRMCDERALKNKLWETEQ